MLQAVTLGVEFPAVIAAADAVFFDLAVIERRAAMAATRVQQACTSPAVPEKNQILAQHAHLLRHGRHRVRYANRMPVTAQILTTQRARAHTDEGFVERAGRLSITA